MNSYKQWISGMFTDNDIKELAEQRFPGYHIHKNPNRKKDTEPPAEIQIVIPGIKKQDWSDMVNGQEWPHNTLTQEEIGI